MPGAIDLAIGFLLLLDAFSSFSIIAASSATTARVQADLAELRMIEELLIVREGGTRASDAGVEAILGCRVTRRAGRAA